MYQVVTKTEFIKSFLDAGRGNDFSYDGLSALYDYLCEIEDETGIEIDYDPIGICCEFAEYENLTEFCEDYGEQYKTLDDIRYVTDVIPVDDERFIVRLF